MNSEHDIESTEHLLQELKKIKLNPKALHAFQEQYTPHYSFQSLSDYLNYYFAWHLKAYNKTLYSLKFPENSFSIVLLRILQALSPSAPSGCIY